jgi:hypothetical protein
MFWSYFIPDVSFTDRCKNLSKAIPIESKPTPRLAVDAGDKDSIIDYIKGAL